MIRAALNHLWALAVLPRRLRDLETRLAVTARLHARDLADLRHEAGLSGPLVTLGPCWRCGATLYRVTWERDAATTNLGVAPAAEARCATCHATRSFVPSDRSPRP